MGRQAGSWAIVPFVPVVVVLVQKSAEEYESGLPKKKFQNFFPTSSTPVPVIMSLIIDDTSQEEQLQLTNVKDKDTSLENEIVINLNNVVCNFSVRCHLNLKAIATMGSNVEYHKTMAVSNR